MSKETLPLRMHMCEDGGSRRGAGKVWGLLCWLGYTNIHRLFSALGNHCDCLVQVLGNTQGSCDIVGCAKRQYAQGQVTFSDMGNDTTYYPITACCNRQRHAALLPVCSLWRQGIQFADGNGLGNLNAARLQLRQGLR